MNSRELQITPLKGKAVLVSFPGSEYRIRCDWTVFLHYYDECLKKCRFHEFEFIADGEVHRMDFATRERFKAEFITMNLASLINRSHHWVPYVFGPDFLRPEGYEIYPAIEFVRQLMDCDEAMAIGYVAAIFAVPAWRIRSRLEGDRAKALL